MKKYQAALVAVMTAVLAACGSANYKTQSVDEFAATVATPGVVVLDVRHSDEFAAGHLANAINIDVEGPDFATQIESLDKSVAYAVYCHSGRRSKIAVDQMSKAGFTSLYNLDGGISAWAAAGQGIIQ